MKVKSGSIRVMSFEKYHEKILSFLSGFQVSSDTPQQKDWDLFDSVARSFETMQGTIARMKLAAYAPDFVIEIPSEPLPQP